MPLRAPRLVAEDEQPRIDALRLERAHVRPVGPGEVDGAVQDSTVHRRDSQNRSREEHLAGRGRSRALAGPASCGRRRRRLGERAGRDPPARPVRRVRPRRRPPSGRSASAPATRSPSYRLDPAVGDGFVAFLSELGDALERPAPGLPDARPGTERGRASGRRRSARFSTRSRRGTSSRASRTSAPSSRRPRRRASTRSACPHLGSAAEALAAGEDLGYPVLVKPADPVEFKRRHRRQAFRCETASELEDAYAKPSRTSRWCRS